MKRKEIEEKYFWNTADLYRDAAEWEKAYKAAEKETLVPYRGKLGKKDTLLACLKKQDEISRRETVRQTQEALRGLPEPYKEVFMWRAFADLSFKQIGQMFHKSDNWACVTYHRARAMIKSRMEGKGHEK